MAISIFPSTAAEFVSNNFVVDMNDTSNNTADTGGVKQAGPYVMSVSTGDSTFDVYFIDEDGNSVGYSNGTSINASGLFSTVVILGVAQDEIISFTYQGSINNADGEGDEPGAGAYLESISPTDLPSIDDTATVTGGNFGADTEITFESGATVLPAKSITVVSGTELLVTRPDGLIEDDSPYTVRAVTTGVPQPAGTNANLLVDEVTAGSDPTWVTTSPLNLAPPNEAFSQTLEATDSDGTVTDYSVVSGTLTTGLILNASTGVLSGTSTASDGDSFTFTVRATDDGGNTTDREFSQTVAVATGGTVTTDAIYTYHTFTSSDTFTVAGGKDVEYLVIAGGGHGGNGSDNFAGGAGGAGGLLNGTESSLASGDYSIIVGAAGASRRANGSNSEFDSLQIAIGGGGGGQGFNEAPRNDGRDGGSGGGGGSTTSSSFGGSPGSGTGGDGTAGQGNDGANGSGTTGGGGGGAGGAGSTPAGGAGITLQDWSDATSIGTGEFAAGGNGASGNSSGASGGPANTGSGGGGEGNFGGFPNPSNGVVILRYES